MKLAILPASRVPSSFSIPISDAGTSVSDRKACSEDNPQAIAFRRFFQKSFSAPSAVRAKRRPESSTLAGLYGVNSQCFMASRLTCLAYKASSIRSEEHTSELQSLLRISYDAICLKNKITYEHIYR